MRPAQRNQQQPHQDVPVALDFSDKILIIHPTAFHLGRSILFLGLIAIAIGAVTCFSGPLFIPALAWFAASVPILGIGTILVVTSVTRP